MERIEDLIDNEFFKTIFKKSSFLKRFKFKYKIIALTEFIKFCNEKNLGFSKLSAIKNKNYFKKKYNNQILFNLMYNFYHFVFSRYIINDKITNFGSEVIVLNGYR